MVISRSIFYFGLAILEAEAGILIPSEHSGLVTNMLAPIDSENYGSLWFAVRFSNCKSWIYSADSCPAFLDCKLAERAKEALALPDQTPLNIKKWENKLVDELPKYQDVVGQLCLAPDVLRGTWNVIVLGISEHGMLNIQYMPDWKFGPRWSIIEHLDITTLQNAFDNPSKHEWALSALPSFPKSKPNSESPNVLYNFVIGFESFDHMIPERFNKLFHGQVVNDRLYINCRRFDTSSGKFDQSIRFESKKQKSGVRLYVRKSEESIEPVCRSAAFGLGKKKCYCASNIVFYTGNHAGKIGKSVLYDFDLALDPHHQMIAFRKRKVEVLSVEHPRIPKLHSFRLDHGSVRSDYRGLEFQWIPATEPSTVDDFIFVSDPLAGNVKEISTFLLDKSGETKGKVFPDQLGVDPIGPLEITQAESGAILVKERRDSRLFKAVVNDSAHLSLVEIPGNTDLISFD